VTESLDRGLHLADPSSAMLFSVYRLQVVSRRRAAFHGGHDALAVTAITPSLDVPFRGSANNPGRF
jgi:hypothetical protein